MEKFIETAVTQAPGLVVLVFLVKTFLGRDKERDAFIQQLHQEHLAARGESRDAIKENTLSNRAVTEAMLTLNTTVQSRLLNNIKSL